MSAEPVVPREDEFDPERNRTIARFKAGLDPKLLKGLGGVPAATSEQLERWEREEMAVSPVIERYRVIEADRQWREREHERRQAEEKRAGPARASVAVLADAKPTPERLPFAPISAALANTPPEPDWLFGGYLAPEVLLLLAGKPKAAGKSTLLFALLGALAEGGDFLGRAVSRCGALLLSEERGVTLQDKRPHLRGAEPHLLMRHQVAGQSWPEVVEQARAYCRKHELRVLIVDTWDKWTGLQGDEESKAGATIAAMEPLYGAAADGLAVVIATHQRKAGGSHGEAVRGSNALVGAVDIVAELERAPEELGPNVRVLRSESRFSSTPEELVCELTDDGYVARDGLAALTETAERERLLDALAGIPGATLADLAESGFGRSATAKRLGAMLKEGLLVREGGGKKGDPYRWRLPKDSSARKESLADGRKSRAADEPEQCELQWE
jgi:hypothetical protein